MRVCMVYDCLFPHTVGGAERWYRSLAERLAADGHEVSYLTLRQWDHGVDPEVAGVNVRIVGPRMVDLAFDAQHRSEDLKAGAGAAGPSFRTAQYRGRRLAAIAGVLSAERARRSRLEL